MVKKPKPALRVVPPVPSVGQLVKEVAESIEQVVLPEEEESQAFSPSGIARDVSRQLTGGWQGRTEEHGLLSPEAQAQLPQST